MPGPDDREGRTGPETEQLGLFPASLPGDEAGASNPAPPGPPEPDPGMEQDLARRQEQLEEYERYCSGCQACALRQGAARVVFGEGRAGARLLLVGEGPGQQEDRQGRPFVGPAGKLLDRILEAAGFRRDQVYIANVVKCRPPGNRPPAPLEVAACWTHLERQIELVRPQLLVGLGAPASQALLGPGLRITRDRGQWGEWRGIPVMPTFHPAALLRDPAKKRPVWEDLQAVAARLGQTSGARIGPDEREGE